MSGYIGNVPVPAATQTRDTFTATAGQTTFATSGYTPSFLDVFLNGVHLVNGTDYTATNGSDVVLTSGAAAGDTLEVVAYSTYQVNSQNYTGGLTVDNDGATVLTVDRATSDGTIVDFQKDGSTVGSIGVQYTNDLFIGTPYSNQVGLRFAGGSKLILPAYGNGTVTNADGTIDLGSGSLRFKDLYLSGGVYLGGTGAANYLDDYETGTFTVTLSLDSGSATLSSNTLSYTKIGQIVTIVGVLRVSSVSSPSGAIAFSLPFASASDGSMENTVRGFAPANVSASLQVNEFFYELGEASSTLSVLNGSGSTVTAGAGQSLQANTTLGFNFSYRAA